MIVVCITLNEQKDAVNNLFDEHSWGPNNFTRQLCSLYGETVSHWLLCEASATEEKLSQLTAISNGIFPEEITPVPNIVLQIYHTSESIEPVDYVAAVLSELNLKFMNDV